ERGDREHDGNGGEGAASKAAAHGGGISLDVRTGYGRSTDRLSNRRAEVQQKSTDHQARVSSRSGYRSPAPAPHPTRPLTGSRLPPPLPPPPPAPPPPPPTAPPTTPLALPSRSRRTPDRVVSYAVHITPVINFPGRHTFLTEYLWVIN